MGVVKWAWAWVWVWVRVGGRYLGRVEANADGGAVRLLALEALDVNDPLAAVARDDLALLAAVVAAGDQDLAKRSARAGERRAGSDGQRMAKGAARGRRRV